MTSIVASDDTNNRPKAKVMVTTSAGDMAEADALVLVLEDGSILNPAAPVVARGAANGVATSGNPVLVAGSDGTNVRTVRTDTLGRAIMAPATASDGFASSAATTNPRVAKASPGTLRQVSGYNASASARYLRFYDTSSSPTAGTTAIRKRVYLPPLSPFVYDYNDAFAAGIAFAITASGADNDATVILAGDILALNVDYL